MKKGRPSPKEEKTPPPPSPEVRQQHQQQQQQQQAVPQFVTQDSPGTALSKILGNPQSSNEFDALFAALGYDVQSRRSPLASTGPGSSNSSVTVVNEDAFSFDDLLTSTDPPAAAGCHEDPPGLSSLTKRLRYTTTSEEVDIDMMASSELDVSELDNLPPSSPPVFSNTLFFPTSSESGDGISPSPAGTNAEAGTPVTMVDTPTTTTTVASHMSTVSATVEIGGRGNSLSGQQHNIAWERGGPWSDETVKHSGVVPPRQQQQPDQAATGGGGGDHLLAFFGAQSDFGMLPDVPGGMEVVTGERAQREHEGFWDSLFKDD
jgi:hypothetical protein